MIRVENPKSNPRPVHFGKSFLAPGDSVELPPAEFFRRCGAGVTDDPKEKSEIVERAVTRLKSVGIVVAEAKEPANKKAKKGASSDAEPSAADPLPPPDVA